MQLSQDRSDLNSKKIFADTPETASAAKLLLQAAADYLAASKVLQESLPIPASSAALDGLAHLCQALCEHYGVQAKTNTTIPAICRELGMDMSDRCFVSAIDERRHQTYYQHPSPSALQYETEILIRLLETYIPKAYQTLGIPH